MNNLWLWGEFLKELLITYYSNESEEKGVTRSEFRYGSFSRVIPLPVEIQNSNVTAEYKDGILNLTLPKVEEEKTQVVKVNVV